MCGAEGKTQQSNNILKLYSIYDLFQEVHKQL